MLTPIAHPMRPVPRTRRLLAPFVALAVLVVGLGADAMFFCADGEARSACCCPDTKTDTDQDRDPQTSISAAPCCDVEAARLASSGEPLVPSERISPELTPLAILGDDLFAIAMPASHQRPPAHRHVGRWPGPPILLIKQSFLL